VIAAYAEAGIPVYRTDRDGAVWITGRISNADVQLHRMRDRIIRPTYPGTDFWSGEFDNWRRIWLQIADE
jgi:competence protein ComEC